jgi:excisionase family DNA binding protein
VRDTVTRPEPSGLLLTFTDAARELGLSLSSVHRLVRSGILPAVRVDTGHGQTRRIRRSDLDAYVDSLARAS